MGVLEVIAEHTRLAREYSELPNNAVSESAYEPIKCRREEITKRIQELKEMEGCWSK
ncbi:hypothetical protein [Robinsoniella peoriensis]|uniref:hypothetical protein n=1 Tax=Robinsoniella peoriensis TaxID=180332 RepID=UPI0036364D7B